MTTGLELTGQFENGRVPGWKTGGSGRIFRGWRQLFNAIAAPSTDALKRSSWYRKQVMQSAQSAALRWNRGWSPPTFPHTNLLNVHRQKVGRTSRPKSPSGPTNSPSRCWSSGASELQTEVSIRRPAIRNRKGIPLAPCGVTRSSGSVWLRQAEGWKAGDSRRIFWRWKHLSNCLLGCPGGSDIWRYSG